MRQARRVDKRLPDVFDDQRAGAQPEEKSGNTVNTQLIQLMD
jgi:hypothetical protein